MTCTRWILVALTVCIAVEVALCLRTRSSAEPEHLPVPVAISSKGSPSDPPLSNRLAGLPRVMLWASGSLEDLRFIDPKRVGVAYLAQTVTLGTIRAEVESRRQPVLFPPGTALVAVVRIESERRAGAHSREDPLPVLSVVQKGAVEGIAAVATLTAQPGLAGVQVDFAASVSQREFYRELLAELRRQLPDRVGLSMTATPSWCVDGGWTEGLPVDEAVPVIFRPGPDHSTVLSRFASGEHFPSRLCQESVGVSTEEPLSKPGERRYYVFSPQPWSRDTFAKISRQLLP